MIEKGIMNANTILASPHIVQLEECISGSNAVTVTVKARQKHPRCLSYEQPSAACTAIIAHRRRPAAAWDHRQNETQYPKVSLL